MALSDIKIKTAKPLDKPYKLSDSGGLYLIVNRNGSKYWRMKYRFAGKEKMLSIGVYWSAQKEYSGKNKPKWKPKTYGKGIYQLDPSIGPQEYDASAFERKW